ncbi:hypothetical protein VTN00DRAFT_1441 [Thermoascus crustaceus]|uniref:uncharacterized protein n=1 Tax=Thermoascus crustaceus TaxID=5088 RepID=UPI00374465CD
MTSQEAGIQPLPADVVAKIKSSISITHLNGVVVELVKNALDADARAIYITVDYRRGGCVVEDDGSGIPPAEFEQNGGLGKPHHTSKLHPTEEVYGRKGLFLASLAALSLMTITSRHILHGTTSTVIFHHSRPVARLIPAPPQQTLEFSSHGTRVTVNDLFGNMPVRVKSRALALQRPDEMGREWDDLKRVLTAVLLANARPVKMVVSDADKSRKLTIQDRSSPLSSSDPAATTVNLTRIGSILAQAGFMTLQGLVSWTTVSARTPEISIHSAISLAPSPTKQVQFISMGIEPVFPHNNANVLYNEVNRIFASSNFGTVEPTHSIDHRKSMSPSKGQTSTSIKGASKAVNRWPMFYIRISTGHPRRLADEDGAPESEKSIQRILDVLGAMIYQFLEQHGFRPRAGRRKRKATEMPPEPDRTTRQASRKVEDIPRRSSPSARQYKTHSSVASTEETLDGRIQIPRFQNRSLTRSIQDFGNWSRVKSGKESTLDAICAGLPRGKSDSSRETSLPCRSLQGLYQETAAENESTKGLESKSTSPVYPEPPQGPENPEAPADVTKVPQSGIHATDDVISWTDPFTKAAVLINARTGQVVPPDRSTSDPTGRLHSISRPCSAGCLETVRNAQSVKRPRSALPRMQGFWLDSIMKKWDNPTFGRVEKPIASIDPGASREVAEDKFTFGKHCCSPSLSGLDTVHFTKFSGKLSKRGLEQADVIAQVDHKFVLVRMAADTIDSDGNPDSGSILTIVDQHAADERCRVEQLFADMFRCSDGSSASVEIQTTRLSPESVFDVAAHEIRLFRQYSDFFTSWGCQYEVAQKPGAASGTVLVDALPTVIAERCRTEPSLVIDLLRAEIWKREENGRGSHPKKLRQENTQPQPLGQSKEGTRPAWVDRIGDCPQGIIDLLNSRACRSAIMFNDVLTVDECRSLISRLARCVFPFQCAHGRPSMIPILDLEPTTATDTSSENAFGLLDSAFGHEQAGSHSEMGLGFAEAFRAWERDARIEG